MKNAIDNKLVPSSAKKSVVAPPPIDFLKSLSSQVSKKSLLRLSAILAPLLLAPFSTTQAANFGSTTCSSTSTTSCVGGTYLGKAGFVVSVEDTLDATPDEKILKLNSGLWEPAYSLTVNASKSIVIANRGTGTNILIQNGAVANLDFGNSVYKGSFIMNNLGGLVTKANLNFDGNYQGNSDDTLKGYAFVGDIAVNLGIMTANFKNDANMKGNITSTNPYNNNISANANINFIGSSLEGDISTRDTGDSANNPAIQNITFDGNSSKGFAMKGSVNNRYGTTNITFNNGAKMVGDLTVGTSGYVNRTSSVNANFNGSSFAGKINTATNAGQFRLTAKNDSTLNIESLVGASGGYYGDMGFTLDNSIFQGKEDGSKISYTNTNEKFFITATNNSKIYMNLKVSGNWFAVRTSTDIDLNKSEWIGNITLDPGRNVGLNSIKFNASTMSGDITGDANLQGYFTDSTIGNITNNNSASVLNFYHTIPTAGASDTSPITIGNITFSGKITGNIANATIGDIKLSSNSGISSDLTLTKSYLKSIFLDNGGTFSLTLDNQSTLSGLNITKGILNVNAKSGSLLLSAIGVSSDGATSNVSLSSDASASGNIDFTKANEVIMQKLQDIAKENLNAKAPIDGSAPSSGVIPPKDDSSKDTFSKEQLITLVSMLKPQDILSYLSLSNISSYAGDILTSGGSNNVDFKDSLYLGGKINTTSGTANITMSFSADFISKLQSNSLTNAFLYGGSGPEFSVTTNGENATNNIALSGSIKGVAQVNYLAGNTNIVFADGSTGAFKGGNSTDFSDKNVFDPDGSDDSKKQVMINGQIYEGGIYVKLDASKADAILKNYRNLFPINTTTFMIDKVTNPAVYTATISGVMIGEVSSLPVSADVKSYQAIFQDNSLFIGRLNITDRNVSIDLSQGSKLILEDGSNVSVLSSALNKDGTKKSFYLDSRDLVGDSIYQSNTIIDLATGGNPSSSSQIKSSYSTLNIGEVKDLNNAIFRVSYNPFSKASDAQKDKTDHIIINSASSSSIQNDYLQAYQNALSPVLGDLRDKKILVVSIKNDFTPKGATEKTAGLVFNTDSSVLQGYDLIQTIFDKKIENSNDGTDTAAAGSSDTWTNYYIAAAKAKISESSKDLTQAAISSNYSIFLANINDLNKRLGELRNNTDAQGVWARVFNGMTTNNRGEEVKTYSTNVQAGYDISLPNASLDGKSYLGFALSYGYNVLSSKSFTGKANLLEVGAYYSYVGNTGFYNDMILKYSFISNDLALQNNQNKNNTFNSSTASLGEELGYRFYFNLKETQTSKHSLYLEPSAEVIFGYVENGGFDQINGNAFLNATINNILAFRGRVGGVLGYSLKTANNQTDFRVGLSYVNDIVGGGKIDFKTNFSDAELDLQSNQMALVSVGVNSILSDRWKVYADVETSFGGTYYNQNYLVSVGGRYAFGKKTNFVQNNQTKPSSSVSDIKAGYYFDVYTLAKNAKLSKEQISLLSKYPHAVLLEKETFVDPRTKNQKTIEVQKILIGPFKTKEGAEKSQNIADEIAKILNKKETKALLKEVK